VPRVATAARLEYEEQRKAARRTPAYRKTRNAQRRKRYADDAEFRESHRTYQQAWRDGQPVNPNTRRQRIARGMIWTPEEEAAHLLKTHCEVCGNEPSPKRGIFADHCHQCRHYRGALCPGCNHALGIIEKWGAVCPEGSPMRLFMDRHTCSTE
jgi:hypothetical protein